MKNLSTNCWSIQLVIFLLLSVAGLPYAFSQNQPVHTDLNNYPLVTIPGTETRSFYSKILEQEMVLYIKIPATYKTDNQKFYPCWYVTDANRSFAMIADMANFFEVPVIVEPEIFIVGIGYKIRDMADWGAWRTRDLTPTNVPSTDTYWAGIFSKYAGRHLDVKTGGSAKFLECIEKEVSRLWSQITAYLQRAGGLAVIPTEVCFHCMFCLSNRSCSAFTLPEALQ